MKIILAIAGLAFLLIFVKQILGGGAANSEENIKIGTEFLEKNVLQDGVKATSSGLQYEVLQAGTGTIHPSSIDKVTVHYHGTLLDGTVFDSSVERNEPIAFGLNQVIKGWTEGLQLLVGGEKTRFTIPSDLAYGNRSTGGIPADDGEYPPCAIWACCIIN